MIILNVYRRSNTTKRLDFQGLQFKKVQRFKKKDGFGTLLWDYVPHILDIGGDTCPHIHITQKFLLPFEKYIDYVCNELLNDFKWSPDLWDHLREICSYLQIKYQMPSDSIYHRWLSPSDEIEMSLHLFPVLQYSTMQSWRKIKGQFIKIQKEVL